MRVYRGPNSKPIYDDTHEFVSRIEAEDLAKAVGSRAHPLRFNITKNGYDRQSVCTMYFEETDLIPMIEGILERLRSTLQTVNEVREIANSDDLTETEKLLNIKIRID